MSDSELPKPSNSEKVVLAISATSLAGPAAKEELLSDTTPKEEVKAKKRSHPETGPQRHAMAWTEEEDKQLFELFKTKGSAWSAISKEFEGRTENQAKNRFYSTLRRIATKKTTESRQPLRSSIHMSKTELVQYVDDAIEHGHNCFSKRGRKKKKRTKSSEVPEPVVPIVRLPLISSSFKPYVQPHKEPTPYMPSFYSVPQPRAQTPLYPPIMMPMSHSIPRFASPSLYPWMPTNQPIPTVRLQARLEEIVMLQQSVIGMLLENNGLPAQSMERSTAVHR